jgi:hypothetical protein
VPGHQVVRQDADAYDELEPAQRQGFDEYFVVRTASAAAQAWTRRRMKAPYDGNNRSREVPRDRD